MHKLFTDRIAAVALAIALLGGCGGGDGQDLTACGNGRLDSGEQCDDGNLDDGDACTAVCRDARCGDGAIRAGVEQCEGLNLQRATCDRLGYAIGGNNNRPGCSSECLFDLALCGPLFTPTPPPATPTPTRTPTQTPTPATTVCGNGLLEPGETCLSCPDDCQPAPCTPDGTTASFAVAAATAGRAPTQLAVRLAYRTTVVVIPGSGSDVAVRQRVRFAPPIPSSFTVADLDYAVDITSTRAQGLPAAPAAFATVRFDQCSGDGGATVEDLACTLLTCTDESGAIPDCRCVVTPQ